MIKPAKLVSTRVLVADDDPVSRRLLQVSLGGAGYEVTIASDGTEALRCLQAKGCPRLAVLDWMMPDVDGLDVIRTLRKRVGDPYVYIILLTAKGHQTEIIEGLEAGADDYITKPFDIHELKARLRVGRRILDLTEQLASAGERLRVQATHDSLTGMFNRMAIVETLERELARAARDGSSISIVMADIDHFKDINDTHGHQAGDAVLQEVALRMKNAIRVYDSLGRYGGEEFLIVSPGCALENAAEQAERIRISIADLPIGVGNGFIPVTMSLGLASTDGVSRDSEALLRLADGALYAAKKGGRNRVEIHSPVHQQTA